MISTKQKALAILGVSVALVSIVFCLSFFFFSNPHHTTKYFRQLKERVPDLNTIYLSRNPNFHNISSEVWRNFEPKPYENVANVWDEVYGWPKENVLYPAIDSTMGQLLNALLNEKIIAARNAKGGRNLKLLLTFTGRQTAIFKPKQQERHEIVEGVVWGGYERFQSEIAAFYVGAILNLRWTPVVVGRKINLKEIYENTANKLLRSTMTVNENRTEYCVFGSCCFCRSDLPVCADSDHTVEGAVLHLVPGESVELLSPWKRNYQQTRLMPWQYNMDYCEGVKQNIPENQLLDFMDVAIFDFLIQNGDRHDYEIREDRVVLIDNGRGFVNPNNDYIDILAPFYQCCVLRRSTWDRLLLFSGGTLTELLDQLLKGDELYPLITEEHYKAMERRLLLLYAAAEICFDRFGKDAVLKGF